MLTTTAAAPPVFLVESYKTSPAPSQLYMEPGGNLPPSTYLNRLQQQNIITFRQERNVLIYFAQTGVSCEVGAMS